MKKFSVDENDPSFCGFEVVLFTKDMKKLIEITPAYPEKKYSVPDGGGYISYSAAFSSLPGRVSLWHCPRK